MKILIRVTKEAKKYWHLLTIAAFSTLAMTGLNLAGPRLMSRMVSLAASGLDGEGLRRVLITAGTLLCIYLSMILFRFLRNYMAHKAAWELVEELRIKVYTTIQSFSMDFYRSRQTGDLISRTVSDTASFESLYAHLLPDGITNLLTLIGVTAMLFIINARLALMTCVPIPLILISGWFFAKKVRPNFRIMQRSQGELSAQLQDNYTGVQEIQAFGQQDRASDKVKNKAHTFTTAMLRALKISAVFHPSVEFLTSLGTVIVVGFGGYLAYLRLIEVGDIVAFLLYLALFYAPITGIAQLLESVQQALAGAERVIELLDTPVNIADKPEAMELHAVDGALEFANVSFYYQQQAPVLNNVSFNVQPGQMLALVGATGVGKTTIAQLIGRFYDPVSGTVKIDGKDIRDLKVDSLRRNIAFVMQETFLFNGTIAENISFARPGASEEEIEEAAKIARIHEDIVSMPDGYETIVGERGARLSGGQKQRVAIARAIICRAPILILDEATASVDVQTEAYIQQAMQELAGKRTVIAIAHRLSTINKADRILVFNEGCIVQQGMHNELVSCPGIYRDMCLAQERIVPE